MISVFDLFKIGIGPSSSHTVGPMVAAKRFRDAVEALPAPPVAAIARRALRLARLDRARPRHRSRRSASASSAPRRRRSTPMRSPASQADLARDRSRSLSARPRVRYDPASDLVFNFVDLLPGHSNGMRFRALDAGGAVLAESVYYSIGGGFVVDEGEAPASRRRRGALSLHERRRASGPVPRHGPVDRRGPARQRGRPCARARRSRTGSTRSATPCSPASTAACALDGELPGGLKVKRRAKALFDALDRARLSNRIRPHEVMDWISTYAIAVNEENAAGGRVVTAPTNGAAGIVPAVLRYFRDFCPEYTEEQSRAFLLSAAAIGSLIKRNASISGAEVGCQGEVGSAASMAAAGLAAGLGATPAQIENAAEIAMEHHLGMTCDPIGGLVQIPCIERNAFGANKAIAAASLALHGDGTHLVSLDAVIETMRQTGADMQSKYKETSQGGLAVNVAEC